MTVENIIDILFMFIKRLIETIEKLRKGEIKPEEVDLEKIIDDLKNLPNLPTK